MTHFFHVILGTFKENKMQFKILDLSLFKMFLTLEEKVNFREDVYGNCLSFTDLAFPFIKEKFPSLQ